MVLKTSPANDPAEDSEPQKRSPRLPAKDVGKEDKHKAEKVTGEHEAYEPEGGDS